MTVATDRLAARVTPRDKALAEAAARHRGLTTSEYLRRVVRQRALRDLDLRPADELENGDGARGAREESR